MYYSLSGHPRIIRKSLVYLFENNETGPTSAVCLPASGNNISPLTTWKKIDLTEFIIGV